jgi:hypothetical protein
MFKKTKLAEDKLKAVVIDEFDLWVEADIKKAERMYCTLIDEGKFLKKYAICCLYIFCSQDAARSTLS